MFPATYRNEEAAAYVVAENFNTHSGADYKGINVGFELKSLNTADIASMEVSLFKDGEEPFVTNSADMDMINEEAPAKGHSTPFIITEGSYVEEYWDLGEFDWTTDDRPTKAVITIVDIYNNIYIVENNSLSESTADFETLITVPDTTEPVISAGRVYFDGVNRINVEFEVNEDIDLSMTSLGNIVIRYGTIVNDEFVDLLRANGTPVTKNKYWSGYLNGPSSEKYSQGFEGNRSYIAIVPADTLMQTTVDSKYDTMNYADQTWNDLLSQGEIVVQVEVTDNAGNLTIIQIDSEN
ncbi:MAG: hypothetical protein K0Q99_1571 [Clostridia bacterium]|nr:hypothetical protein [Clostridia bacterium]